MKEIDMSKINLISVYPSFKFSWKGQKYHFNNGVLVVDFEDAELKEFRKAIVSNPAFVGYIREADEAKAKAVAEIMAKENANNASTQLGAQTTNGANQTMPASPTSQAAIFGKVAEGNANEGKPESKPEAPAQAPVKSSTAPVNQPPLPKP